MRGADTFTESPFTLHRLEDFVPAERPLRPIRQMVNKALEKRDVLTSTAGFRAKTLQRGRHIDSDLGGPQELCAQGWQR